MQLLAQRACHLAAQREPLVHAATLFRAAQVVAPLDAAQARTLFSAGVDLLERLPLSDRIRRALEQEAVRAGADADPESAILLLRRSTCQAEHLRGGHLVTLLLMALVRAGEAARASDLYQEFGGGPHAANMLMQGTTDPEIRRQTLAAARHRWQRRDHEHTAHRNPFASGDYFGLLAAHWDQLPRAEAREWLQEAVDAIAAEPELRVQAGLGDEATFTKLRDWQLFQLLNALAGLWPPHQLDALLAAHPELAAAAQRYPRGMQSVMVERIAEARPSGGNGFVFHGAGGGGPDDAARQLPLALRSHAGDPTVITDYFGEAVRLFHEDTDPAAPNAAPRIFWPSCSAYRKAAYWTGKLEGSGGEPRLNQVPDHDFVPLALLDFAAGVLGQASASGIAMRLPGGK